jgi:hypothetical protein
MNAAACHLKESAKSKRSFPQTGAKPEPNPHIIKIIQRI